MSTRIGLVSLLVFGLAGCASLCPPPPPPKVIEKPVPYAVDTTCDGDKAIYIDAEHDVLTPGTYEQIRDHNVWGMGKCGWKPSTKKK